MPMASSRRRLAAISCQLREPASAVASDNLHECFATVGPRSVVEPGCRVGFKYHADAGPAAVGKGSIVRAGTIIYGDVQLGDYFQSGHNAVIRARVRCGDYCTVFNIACLEGLVRMGRGCRIMTNCYLPTRTWLGDDVFLGPGVTVTNSRYPGRLPDLPSPRGPTIEDGMIIGGGVTILAGVRIGAGSFVAAGATVVSSVPPGSFVRGTPGVIEPLPPHLDVAASEELTSQTLDLWHPLAPSCDVRWPEDWPERWDESESPDADAVVDGQNGRQEVYNMVMGWVRGCFLGCDTPEQRSAMRTATTRRVAELAANANTAPGGLTAIEWVKEPVPVL
eukprot:SAG22_NODE_4327_length_1304_cov_1.491272_1_plen_335_part_00